MNGDPPSPRASVQNSTWMVVFGTWTACSDLSSCPLGIWSAEIVNYMCIYIHNYVCVYVYVIILCTCISYIYIYMYIIICMYIYIYISIYACMYGHGYIAVYTYLYTIYMYSVHKTMFMYINPRWAFNSGCSLRFKNPGG